MRKIKLALIDDNTDLCEILASQIEKLYSNTIEIVGAVHNGSDAINLIKTKSPDIAIIDIMLPDIEGYNLIRLIKQNISDKKVDFIILSAANTDYIKSMSFYAGAEYFLGKPFEMKRLVDCVVNIYNYKQRILSFEQSIKFDCYLSPNNKENISFSPSHFAESLLYEIGVPKKLKGFHYLKTTIELCIEKPDFIDMLTKKLYPEVALIHNSKWTSVERTMRHSLISAWKGENSFLFHKMMGNKTENPALGAFLRAVIDIYKSKSVQ